VVDAIYRAQLDAIATGVLVAFTLDTAITAVQQLDLKYFERHFTDQQTFN
jgi:hypothetical protein